MAAEMRFRVFRIERALPIADERRPSVNFKATLTVEHEMAARAQRVLDAARRPAPFTWWADTDT